ncbi:MAG: DUF484 family protein [Rhodobacteraceae bacterium]|nr:DUF484 family protein [Paracoccaceae bacterium]
MTTKITDTLRAQIIAHPDVILEDPQLLQALAGMEASHEGDVIDLRKIALRKIQGQLDRLQNQHDIVVATAHENLLGMANIHRATLALLEAEDFNGFLNCLGGAVASILRVDAVRLMLSAEQNDASTGFERFGDVLLVAPSAFVASYVGGAQDLSLGRPHAQAERIYGTSAGRIGSEACMALDLGPDRAAGLLVLGAQEGYFHSGQRTDLLNFFAAVVERLLRGWLA